jgi:hypothetical protein
MVSALVLTGSQEKAEPSPNKMLALYYFNWSSKNGQASCGGERQAGAQNTFTCI